MPDSLIPRMRRSRRPFTPQDDPLLDAYDPRDDPMSPDFIRVLDTDEPRIDCFNFDEEPTL